MVFTEPYSQSWEFEGKKPMQAYEVVNAYEVDGKEGGEIRYERFYRVYLYSYAISILTFSSVIVFYLDLRRKIQAARN